MKTVRLVLGIVSLALSVFVLFQSCVAGVGNALAPNGEVGGTAGLLLVICLVVGGILLIVGRDGQKRGLSFTASGFYVLGGLIGMLMAGSYSDLLIWGGLSIVFGAVVLIGTLKKK